MINEKRLEEIRKRCDAALPSPWSVRTGIRESYHNGRQTIYSGSPEVKNGVAVLYNNSASCEFIINSRQDIPDLLAHIDELEKLSALGLWARDVGVPAMETLNKQGNVIAHNALTKLPKDSTK